MLVLVKQNIYSWNLEEELVRRRGQDFLDSWDGFCSVGEEGKRTFTEEEEEEDMLLLREKKEGREGRDLLNSMKIVEVSEAEFNGEGVIEFVCPFIFACFVEFMFSKVEAVIIIEEIAVEPKAEGLGFGPGNRFRVETDEDFIR